MFRTTYICPGNLATAIFPRPAARLHLSWSVVDGHLVSTWITADGVITEENAA